MEEQQENSFENKMAILSELWMNYRFDSEFEDFISYNDIGLPLAFLITEELVKPSERAKAIAEESYAVLLAALKREDGDYESLDDLLVG